MATLQELSVRLSLFICSLPLSSMRQASSRAYRRHCRVDISSYRSAVVVDWQAPVSLSSRASCKFFSRRTEDFMRALGVSNSGGSQTEDLSLDVVETTDDIDSPLEDLESDASNRSGETKFPTDTPELGASRGMEFVKYVRTNVPAKRVQSPNYLTMSDKELFANCRMDTYRASGPGGQHRNKTDSAVRLTHIPTGLVSQAADDRSQHINRALALTRMRQVIALEVRDLVELEGYKPPPELVRILPSGLGGKRGNSQKIGPNHPEFVLGLKALLDLLWVVGGSVSVAGTTLGLSTGAMSKLITSNNLLWQGVNKLRASKGLKPLR